MHVKLPIGTVEASALEIGPVDAHIEKTSEADVAWPDSI